MKIITFHEPKYNYPSVIAPGGGTHCFNSSSRGGGIALWLEVVAHGLDYLGLDANLISSDV